MATAVELRKKGGGVSAPNGFNDDEIEHERIHRERYSLLGCSPDFIQPLASPKFFLFLSIATSALSGIARAGWVANLTSIERRFKMPFAVIGLMHGMSEIGGLLSLFIFAHFAGNGHRPKWIGVSMALMTVSICILTSPELWVPPTTLSGGVQPPSPMEANNNMTMMSRREQLSSSGMCVVGDDLQCPALNVESSEEEPEGGWQLPVFVTFVVAFALMDGAGQGSAIIKAPYYYDNVKPKNFPIYIGLETLFTGAGSAIGLFSMAFFANVYYRPWDMPPGVRPGDPQWIAAWYLPMLTSGSGLLIVAIFYMGFPRQLRLASREEAEAAIAARKRTDDSGDGEDGYAERGAPQVLRRKLKAKHLPRDIWRLVTNPIVMCLAAGRALDFVTAVGNTVKVKYLENQFRVMPAQAALYMAIFGLSFAALAQFLGSLVIKRWFPRPRTIMLAIWITQAIAIALTALQAHITCEKQAIIVGQSDVDANVFDFNTTCSAQCQCRDERFQPVCDHARNVNYFSPCRAGCSGPGRRSVQEDGSLRLFYDNCSCIDSDPSFVDGDQIERGWCEGECEEGFLYVIVNATLLFISGLPLTGNLMILYLVVEPELKSHAMSMIAFAQTVLMPGGLFVTVLFDSACARWSGEGGVCATGDGASTNCAIYDTNTLALRVHYFGVIVKVLGQLSDTYVLYAVWNMVFPKVDDKSKEEEE